MASRANERPQRSLMEGLIDEEIIAEGGWRVIRRFLPYLYPHKDKVLLMFLMTLVGVPLAQISVFMGRYLIDEVILNTQRPVQSRLWLFFVVVGIQAVMWFIWRTMHFVRQVMAFSMDVRVSVQIRRLFYSHLHRLSLDFFRTRPIGEHMYRTGEVGGILPLVTDDFPNLIDLIYRVIWGGILVSVVDWRITVLILVYIIPYTIMAYWAYNYLQRVNVENRIWGQRAASVLRDSVAGFKTVKAYGRTRHQARTYAARLIDQARISLKWFFLAVMTHHFLLWTYRVIVSKLKWLYIAYQTMNGNLSIGEFSVMFWLVGQLERPLQQVVQHIQNIRMHMVPAMRVLETLEMEPEIADAPNAPKLPPVKGRIEFHHVHFHYVENHPVLRDIHFTLEPGTFAAFVGPSGGGKSTILYLLLRLWDVREGTVLVDGHDIRSVRLRSWLDQVGVVLQETFLFGGTLADNILYGNPKASEAQLWEAIRQAELDQFVARHPAGIHTQLGEGTKLSGGERQRIGLARALIRNPRVLVLDEPTAYLDAHTETSIMRSFRAAMRGRTTLMVSHRLVPIQDADVIYVLEDGRITESGTHEELLEQNGLYRRMWDEQTEIRGINTTD